ncbi:adenylyl-sulfate kinase [Synechococcus sp. PCC 6312]|uniref:adenylyl-sulfate kinase n=1 Tax=Synechococcus sp. (strain ATCC 27167 / PCC 6312) TaxID=195253 RepID=UPI00029F41E0|nr:adenylyl-sulfate kinase [Synechococcus sp. PCC 6312]AFY59324.1 adenylylsulfate kinase ApsK [Synechococcus sp. PCC 6312]
MTDEKSMNRAISGGIIWLTGLSGSGKSTIATHLCKTLIQANLKVEILDGDQIRSWLSPGLGFSKADRDLNVQRVGMVANLLSRNGVLVIVAMISPYREIRNQLKATTHNFIEIFINAPLEVCEVRDIKGLYAQARAGNIQGFTGVSDPYEIPLEPDLICHTADETIAESVSKILQMLSKMNLIPSLQA